MKKALKIVVLSGSVLLLLGTGTRAKDDAPECGRCDEARPGSPGEVRIEYRGGSSRTACGLRCAGAMLAAYRKEDVKTIWIREHGSGQLLDAKKAFWVLAPEGRSWLAFSSKAEAGAYSSARGGRVANFRETMTAVFEGMYDGMRNVQPLTGGEIKDDIAGHPRCVYCGMDRAQYAYSRVLLRYSDGSEAGLCSIHCAGIDLALHPEKVPARILAGTYDRRDLVDAEKAVWVLGGSKQGVMSIRGKWAFEKKEDAEAFMRESGGSITGFRNVMNAVFEDMWEIIR